MRPRELHAKRLTYNEKQLPMARPMTTSPLTSANLDYSRRVKEAQKKEPEPL
jgi:hypothetical protein